MTKPTITRDRLEEIRDCCWMDDLGLSMCELSELARMALAAMDSEPVAIVEPSDYVTAAQLVGEGPARKAVHELYEGALRIGDKLYRHAQPAPVVDADDNFYSWFGREWQENYQHNQYTTAAKQMLGVMAESAWKAGRRAAMLQAGALTNEDTRQVDELTMWIKRLVRSLKNANPDSKLPREAMDYLTAKGLISVGDILR